MTYDQWKTTDPRDYEPEEPECDHEEYDIDVSIGRASCHYCDRTWYLSPQEIDAHFGCQVTLYKDMVRDELRHRRREFWRNLTLPIRWPIFRLLERVWPRKSLIVLTDDEIPF